MTAPTEPLTTAADCYDTLKQIAARLEELHAAGQLTMSTDPTNTTWQDLDSAITATSAALDVAIQATAWMNTTQ